MRSLLTILALALAPTFAVAAKIDIIALTAGKAVVVIDNGKPQTMKAGQVSPEGIKLIEASSASATFEIEGRRRTLRMGQSIALGGGPVSAGRATLIADTGGHFLANVVVNGVTLKFMVDTGASLVTISSTNAKRAGINYLAGRKAVLQTANGTTPGYRVKLDTVRLGDITLHNVDGVVVEGNVMGGALGLLGLSFLNHTDMKRDGQTLTLIRRY